MSILKIPNMIAIENQIDTFFAETESSVKRIIEGSDEHLDMILSITRPLDELSEKFERFNNVLTNELNKYSEDQLKNTILPKLKDLNKSCMTLVGAIMTSFLYRDIRTSFKKYSKQYDILRELIHDVQNLTLAKDDELDSLMKELNDL